MLCKWSLLILALRHTDAQENIASTSESGFGDLG